MAIRVFRTLVCVDGVLVADDPKASPKEARGNVAGLLSSLDENPSKDGPSWSLELSTGTGASTRSIRLPLNRFLSADEHRRSLESPVLIENLATSPKRADGSASFEARVWLFRDAFYVTERSSRPSELEEVSLRIKARHFQDDLALKRLREQVASFEAIGHLNSIEPDRHSIPDDVKLLVWSRDGGACVRCHATGNLHFDRIVPLVSGGGDHAENIQLLCCSCYLSKGGR
jgi:hypothetical protein